MTRKGKHDDIPTEQMFDAQPYRDAPTTQRAVKSVAQGKCPLCTRPKVGLIRSGVHIAWRRHTYRTWGNTSVDCVASGIYACILPEENPLDPSAPVSCRHR